MKFKVSDPQSFAEYKLLSRKPEASEGYRAQESQLNQKFSEPILSISINSFDSIFFRITIKYRKDNQHWETSFDVNMANKGP